MQSVRLDGRPDVTRETKSKSDWIDTSVNGCMPPLYQAMEIIERRAFLKCFDSGKSYNEEISRVTVRGTIKKDVRQE